MTPCAPSKHGPPNDADKKLAAQEQKHPDDGQNHARSAAKEKLLDHHLRTNVTTGHRTTDEQAKLQGGHGIYQRPLTDDEVRDAKNKVDHRKGVHTFGEPDEPSGGVMYTNQPDLKPGGGKPGFKTNIGTSDTD